MIEHESLLRQETVGERVEICDLCGQPTAHATSVVIDGAATGSEPVEHMRLCPTCHERMYRDDLAVDDELTPNIEPDDE